MRERTPEQQSRLRVAIVEANSVRAAIIVGGLHDAGIVDAHVISGSGQLLRSLADLEPDVVVIGLENPGRDVLTQMFRISRLIARPVVMFVDNPDSDMTGAAAEAGVSAYVVDGLRRERIRAIVHMAVSRFEVFDRLQRERDAACDALAARKIVDRAKGMLMQGRQMTEAEAYALLRRTAMNEKRKLVDVAQSLVTAASLIAK
ncbi:ANTAR domain-containing response regulator [Camelimonas lactis]|uniref:Response regulator NasT n=1 Tax=Camelimonas lactis TaxID=659006 RepID=A0A4R2GRP4_9HYPH|nr:ANTAR domain-containing protein [Camelimonas lactis]TCO12794.1 response regulator NasT [Camelimonas lactis]